MSRSLNVAFGKTGRFINFSREKLSPIGGDNEPSCILRSLANRNPDCTFYLIGKSNIGDLNDHDRLTLFPYDNVVDVWENKKYKADGKGYPGSVQYYDQVTDFFEKNDVRVDHAVVMIGPKFSSCVFGMIERTDGKGIATPSVMAALYAAPIVKWLNATDVPWIGMMNDPRCNLSQTRDLIRPPRVILSQYDYEYTMKAIRSYEDQERVPHRLRCFYSGMETAFCYDYDHDKVVRDAGGRSGMKVVLNEGKPSRYPELKRWVLDHTDDVEVYGRWTCPEAEKDPRFRGSMNIFDIQKMLRKTRYTLIVPIAKGWVTSKYVEMINAGVIPFFHPTYDEQRHVDVPDILRLRTPDDLWRRIALLDENETMYRKLLDACRAVLKPEWYDGSFMSRIVMQTLYRDLDLGTYEEPDRSGYEIKRASSLEDLL